MWKNVDGVLMHARLAEGAEDSLPAVFVHGLGVASRYFEPALALLAGRRLGWAPDLPGFGWSGAPRARTTLSTLADALEAWLVANSVGCQVVVELARRGNERAVRTALVGPTLDPSARTIPRSLARWARNAIHEPPSLLPILVRDYLQAGVRRPAQLFIDALHDPVEAKLPGVAVPTLVVRGERDRILSPGWAAEVARLLPDGRFAEVPGAAHTVNYAAPAQLAAVLEPFLAEGD